jgi:hypothetical protein
MSKLLRLPLTLLAVLAAMLFLPGIAWGDPLTPPAMDCAANAGLAGCDSTGGGDTSANNATGAGTAGGDVLGGTTADQPTTAPVPGPVNNGGTTGQQQSDPSSGQPAGSLLVVPFQLPTTNAAPVVGVNDVPAPPLLCDSDPATPLPDCPTLPGGTPGGTPGAPLTCDQLATLLHLSGGCPSSFSCDDLAALFGVTCPAGPPDCATLAELFHLQGCPQPPTSCQEFADLLGVDHCSQIPCLDTSKLPQQARDGLGPLFDGLKKIGIKECPAAPTTSGGTTPPGQGTYMPPSTAQQQQPYYANCTDAKAQGASNIPQGSPGYRPELDADHDGLACDEAQPAAAPTVTTAQPTGKLAYTGLDLGPQLNLVWTLLVLGTGLLIVGRRRA